MIGTMDRRSHRARPHPRRGPARRARRRGRRVAWPRSSGWRAPARVADRAIGGGSDAYGVTTGVGIRKTFRDPGRRTRSAARAPAPLAPGPARRRTTWSARPRSGSRTHSRRGRPWRGRCSPCRRRGAERGPAARDPRARLDRPERSRADGRSRGRDPRRLRARAGRGDRAAQPELVLDRVRARSRSLTRSGCSTRSIARARSTSRRSAPIRTRCTPRSVTRVPTPGSSRRSPACSELLEGAKSSRGRCRTRSASGRSPR